MRLSFTFIIFLIFIAGAVVLQIFLSKRQNKWLGLILPLICLSFSLIITFGNIMFSATTSTEDSYVENGVVTKVIKQKISTIDIEQSAIITLTFLFIYNIPTIILLAVYYACREKIKRKKELEKMNIQDLE